MSAAWRTESFFRRKRASLTMLSTSFFRVALPKMPRALYSSRESSTVCQIARATSYDASSIWPFSLSALPMQIELG
jgi:hypothetical protein